MSDLYLSVQKRKDVSAKSLREKTLVPCVIYGKGKPSLSIQAEYEPLRKLIRSAHKHIPFTLDIEGESVHALIKSYDLHPVKNIIDHVDMYILDDNVQVTVPVPVEFFGTSDVLRTSVLTVSLQTLPITCFPKDIPQNIMIDLSLLNPADPKIVVKDITVPENTSCSLDPKTMIAKAAAVRGLTEAAATEDAIAAANS